MASAPSHFRQAAVVAVKGAKICLVTSSNGKRWVVPKGLIDPGHTAGETALIEAWEEAGLVGSLAPEPLGSYIYQKMGGTYHVVVFLMKVTESAEAWPEKSLRRREWVSLERALDAIEEPGLRQLIEAAAEVA